MHQDQTPRRCATRPHPELRHTAARVAEAAVRQGQRCPLLMVLGPSDAGKTTLSWCLARALTERHRQTAFLDADLGQSDVGPPTTVGWTWYVPDLERERPVEAREIYFVGATSPADCILGTAIGTARMTQAARAAGAEAIVIDTCGLVSGPVARELKHALIDLLRPSFVVAIQRKRELEHILAPWERCRSITLERLPSPEHLASKPRGLRRRRRQEAFAAYFRDTTTMTLDLRHVALHGLLPGLGEPVDGITRSLAQNSLGSRLIHAERSDAGVLLVTERPVSSERVRTLQEQLPEEAVIVRAQSELEGLLVALVDPEGRHTCLGRLLSVGVSAHELRLAVPIVPTEVCGVIAGRTSVDAEGRETDQS